MNENIEIFRVDVNSMKQTYERFGLKNPAIFKLLKSIDEDIRLMNTSKTAISDKTVNEDQAKKNFNKYKNDAQRKIESLKPFFSIVQEAYSFINKSPFVGQFYKNEIKKFTDEEAPFFESSFFQDLITGIFQQATIFKLNSIRNFKGEIFNESEQLSDEFKEFTRDKEEALKEYKSHTVAGFGADHYNIANMLYTMKVCLDYSVDALNTLGLELSDVLTSEEEMDAFNKFIKSLIPIGAVFEEGVKDKEIQFSGFLKKFDKKIAEITAQAQEKLQRLLQVNSNSIPQKSILELLQLKNDLQDPRLDLLEEGKNRRARKLKLVNEAITERKAELKERLENIKEEAVGKMWPHTKQAIEELISTFEKGMDENLGLKELEILLKEIEHKITCSEIVQNQILLMSKITDQEDRMRFLKKFSDEFEPNKLEEFAKKQTNDLIKSAQKVNAEFNTLNQNLPKSKSKPIQPKLEEETKEKTILENAQEVGKNILDAVFSKVDFLAKILPVSEKVKSEESLEEKNRRLDDNIRSLTEGNSELEKPVETLKAQKDVVENISKEITTKYLEERENLIKYANEFLNKDLKGFSEKLEKLGVKAQTKPQIDQLEKRVQDWIGSVRSEEDGSKLIDKTREIRSLKGVEIAGKDNFVGNAVELDNSLKQLSNEVRSGSKHLEFRQRVISKIEGFRKNISDFTISIVNLEKESNLDQYARAFSDIDKKMSGIKNEREKLDSLIKKSEELGKKSVHELVNLKNDLTSQAEPLTPEGKQEREDTLMLLDEAINEKRKEIKESLISQKDRFEKLQENITKMQSAKKPEEIEGIWSHSKEAIKNRIGALGDKLANIEELDKKDLNLNLKELSNEQEELEYKLTVSEVLVKEIQLVSQVENQKDQLDFLRDVSDEFEPNKLKGFQAEQAGKLDKILKEVTGVLQVLDQNVPKPAMKKKEPVESESVGLLQHVENIAKSILDTITSGALKVELEKEEVKPEETLEDQNRRLDETMLALDKGNSNLKEDLKSLGEQEVKITNIANEIDTKYLEEKPNLIKHANKLLETNLKGLGEKLEELGVKDQTSLEIKNIEERIQSWVKSVQLEEDGSKLIGKTKEIRSIRGEIARKDEFAKDAILLDGDLKNLSAKVEKYKDLGVMGRTVSTIENLSGKILELTTSVVGLEENDSNGFSKNIKGLEEVGKQIAKEEQKLAYQIEQAQDRCITFREFSSALGTYFRKTEAQTEAQQIETKKEKFAGLFDELGNLCVESGIDSLKTQECFDQIDGKIKDLEMIELVEKEKVRQKSDELIKKISEKQVSAKFLGDPDLITELEKLSQEIQNQKNLLDKSISNEKVRIDKGSEQLENLSTTLDLYSVNYGGKILSEINNQYENLKGYLEDNKRFFNREKNQGMHGQLEKCQKELEALQKIPAKEAEFKDFAAFSLLKARILDVKIDIQTEKVGTRKDPRSPRDSIYEKGEYTELNKYLEELKRDLAKQQKKGKLTQFSTTQKLVDAIEDCFNTIRFPEQYEDIFNAPEKLKMTVDALLPESKAIRAAGLVNLFSKQIKEVQKYEETNRDPLRDLLDEKKQLIEDRKNTKQVVNDFVALSRKGNEERLLNKAINSERELFEEIKQENIKGSNQWENLVNKQTELKERVKDEKGHRQEETQNKINIIESFKDDINKAKSLEEIDQATEELDKNPAINVGSLIKGNLLPSGTRDVVNPLVNFIKKELDNVAPNFILGDGNNNLTDYLRNKIKGTEQWKVLKEKYDSLWKELSQYNNDLNAPELKKEQTWRKISPLMLFFYEIDTAKNIEDIFEAVNKLDVNPDIDLNRRSDANKVTSTREKVDAVLKDARETLNSISDKVKVLGRKIDREEQQFDVFNQEKIKSCFYIPPFLNGTPDWVDLEKLRQSIVDKIEYVTKNVGNGTELKNQWDAIVEDIERFDTDIVEATKEYYKNKNEEVLKDKERPFTDRLSRLIVFGAKELGHFVETTVRELRTEDITGKITLLINGKPETRPFIEEEWKDSPEKAFKGNLRRLIEQKGDGEFIDVDDEKWLGDHYKELYESVEKSIFGTDSRNPGFVELLKQEAQYFINRKIALTEGGLASEAEKHIADLQAAIETIENMTEQQKAALINVALISRLEQKEPGDLIRDGEKLGSFLTDPGFYASFCFQEKIFPFQNSLMQISSGIGMAVNDPQNYYEIKIPEGEGGEIQLVLTAGAGALGAYGGDLLQKTVNNVITDTLKGKGFGISDILISPLSAIGPMLGATAAVSGVTAICQDLRNGKKLHLTGPLSFARRDFTDNLLDKNLFLRESLESYQQRKNSSRSMLMNYQTHEMTEDQMRQRYSKEGLEARFGEEVKVQKSKEQEKTGRFDVNPVISAAEINFREKLEGDKNLNQDQKDWLLRNYASLYLAMKDRISNTSWREPGFEQFVKSELRHFYNSQKPYLDKVSEAERLEFERNYDNCEKFVEELFRDFSTDDKKAAEIINQILLARALECKAFGLDLKHVEIMSDEGTCYKHLYQDVLGRGDKTLEQTMSGLKMLSASPENQLKTVKYPTWVTTAIMGGTALVLGISVALTWWLVALPIALLVGTVGLAASLVAGYVLRDKIASFLTAMKTEILGIQLSDKMLESVKPLSDKLKEDKEGRALGARVEEAEKGDINKEKKEEVLDENKENIPLNPVKGEKKEKIIDANKGFGKRGFWGNKSLTDGKSDEHFDPAQGPSLSTTKPG